MFFYLFYTIYHTSIRQSILITFSKKQIKKSAENNTSFDVYLLPFSLLNGIICFYTKQTQSQLVNPDYTVKSTINQDQTHIFYANLINTFSQAIHFITRKLSLTHSCCGTITLFSSCTRILNTKLYQKLSKMEQLPPKQLLKVSQLTLQWRSRSPSHTMCSDPV